MSAQQLENCWAIHSHMNQPREKHRHLGASLLLTSSFAHHKQQLSRQKKQRMEQQASSHASYHQQVLQAKRINEARQADNHVQPYGQPLSSLDELKSHAKRLMDQQTTKLGKENDPVAPAQSRTITAISEQTEPVSAFKHSKKPNKRRIVKGRPEMYAVTRRRAFILNLLDQEKQNNCQKGIINQLLNKNNLLKFISTQNDKAETHNLYDNLERHKTIEEFSIPKKNSFEHRKSLINFSESGRVKLQQARRNTMEGEKETLRGQVFNLKRRKYSSIKTIE